MEEYQTRTQRLVFVVLKQYKSGYQEEVMHCASADYARRSIEGFGGEGEHEDYHGCYTLHYYERWEEIE